LRDLCADVGAYSLPPDSRAAIKVQAIESDLPAEQAVWLGLIVVEFVTNALKYAKPSLLAPILIEVTADAGQLRVSVADRGAGLPDAFDPFACTGLGMQVAVLLVRQLRGTLGIDRAWAGTRFVVTVPMIAASAQG
jgi:two-component sensor histidine kinase